MDKLIPTVNRLRTALRNLGENTIGLPQLVVVGSQSTGKSSVLEHIVGRDFLPRGTDIVTRCPLVLQLFNSSGLDGKEWGEFDHIPNRKFFNFDEIRQEIENQTVRLAGEDKGVVDRPINLKIYSPNVLDLTLVDLPGIIKNPVGRQPKDIEKTIKAMVKTYVSNQNAIILAVSAANTDLANSEALKMAREVDPEGLRTLGILTKVDIMDAGTDVLPILNGSVYPLRLGYIPVVNRGQADIKANKRIAQALKSEKEFFLNHESYRSISHKCGTAYLAQTLNQLLLGHIQNKLPSIRKKMEDLLAKTKQRYEALGGSQDPHMTQGPTVLRMLDSSSGHFIHYFEGNPDIRTRELLGGALISEIFSQSFARALTQIDPCKDFQPEEIRIAIRNSSGLRPSLLVSDRSFENLVQKVIPKLLGPSLDCSTMVYQEMLQMIEKSAPPELSQYPVLREQSFEIIRALLRERLRVLQNFIKDFIQIQGAYINTNHPDFTSGFDAVEKFLAQKAEAARQPKPPQGKAKAPEPDQSSSGFLSRLIGTPRQDPSTGLADVIPPTALIRAPLTEKEEMEIHLITTLIRAYFDIVRKEVRDIVPKATIHLMFNYLQSNLRNRMIQGLYKEEKFAELLQEDPAVAQEKAKCRETIEALTQGLIILASL